MVVTNLNPLCKEAELHYYDFILGKGHELIPEYIVEHISQCQNCQEQLNQLKVALSQADSIDPEQSHANSATTTMLKLHFTYIGEPATCQTVRPFLPTLLNPVLAIRIPTPITAHLDNCPQCSEDLETIRGLNLNLKQLCRLSQLLADGPSRSKVTCSQAQAAILFVVLMTLRETDAEVLKHLCLCPHCRRALYDYREAVRKDLVNETEQTPFPCEEVSASDIFDYVVPYGLDPAKNQYARFRESLCSHVRRCPACLGKMQQLHDTVYALLDRAESEVATVYKIDDSAKGRATSESNDLYSGFPIKVNVIREDQVQAEELPLTPDFAAKSKHKLSATRLKPVIRIGIAAAAALLIGVCLLLNTLSAKAVTVEQIYKAIDKIRNVYVASFVPEKKEPVQEKWVSRALNVYMTKTGEQLVLWDFQNKIKKTRHPDSNLVETTELSAAKMITEIGMTMTTFLGLVPFPDLSVLPADAGWSRVTDDSLEATARDTEVYDLTWVSKAYDGSEGHRRWRVFVDPKTNLPKRAEFYQKLPAEDEYTFISSMEIEYLSDSKMQSIIRDVFSGQ